MARRVIRLPQIAEKTALSVNTLRYLRNRNEGPPTFRLSGHVVAFEDEVDAWVEKQANGPTAVGRKAVGA